MKVKVDNIDLHFYGMVRIRYGKLMSLYKSVTVICKFRVSLGKVTVVVKKGR